MSIIALAAIVLLAVAPPSIVLDGAFVKAETLDGAAISALPHVSLVVDEARRRARDVGPFRMLAPCDKTRARWVREVTGFSIVTIPDTKLEKPA
jgi:hypothetical protein